MCNTTRKSWEPLGPQLAAAGIHALSVDYRGFGESGGDRFERCGRRTRRTPSTRSGRAISTPHSISCWRKPASTRRGVGAAGGSCGVTHAVRLARRHPEVQSLVLLAGRARPDGLTYITETPWLPIFAAAAADDQFDDDSPGSMQWILAMSGNPRNKFSGFKDGKHGTEIFGPHPELPKQIVAWYVDTLVKRPADPKAPVRVKNTPTRQFWQKAVSPDGVSAAVQLFYETRTRSRAILFPEAQLTSWGTRTSRPEGAAGHAAVQGEHDGVPWSANTFDSLGDAYLANGQNELALRASEKAIEMLARIRRRGPEEGDSRERRAEDREAQRKPEN